MWKRIVKALAMGFDTSAYMDFNMELSKNKQKSMAVEFQEQLEELSNKVKGWPHQALIRAIVGGLREDLNIKMQATRPQSLLESFELARIAEGSDNKIRDEGQQNQLTDVEKIFSKYDAVQKEGNQRW